MDQILGAFFGGFIDRLNALIENAGNVANDVVIHAGVEARRTVEQAQIAYASSLNLTMDRLDAQTANMVARVAALANGVLNRQQEILSNATSEALQVINALPFNAAARFPQLRSITPAFVSAEAQIVHLIFKGNFLQAGNPNFNPVLRFGNIQFAPIQNETGRLLFDIPYNQVFPNRVQNGIGASNRGQLEIPYEQNVAPAIYRVFLRSLPPSPGAISLEITTNHHRHEKRRIETGRFAAYVTPGHFNDAWHVCSCDRGDCLSTNGHRPSDPNNVGKNDDEERDFTAVPTQGWQIIPGTSSYRLEELQGNPEATHIRRDDQGGVTYHFTTEHHGLGTSASINANISFEEKRLFDQQIVTIQNIALRWANSQAFTPQQLKGVCDQTCVGNCTSSWKVRFTDFRNRTQEFVTSSTANPYLSVTEGGGMTLAAAELNSLQEMR